MVNLTQKPQLDIFQIELTNFCDMSCSYCPHHKMTREKGHMAEPVLERCITYAKDLGKEHLILHHFGEPLLHPALESRLLQIKEAGLAIGFSTNGTLLDKLLPMMIALDTDIDITLSVHQWTEAPVSAYWSALASLQERVKGHKVNIQKAYNVNLKQYFFCSWVAGRVRDWNYDQECYFLRENSGVVLWNGDIASCCLDCHGESIVSNINRSDARHSKTRSWRGCPSCDLGYRSRLQP
jgi:organic radical activating enzyme